MPGPKLDGADRLAAETFLKAIEKTDDGFYTSSTFDKLFGAAHMTRAVGKPIHFPHQHLVAATRHFGHLATLIHKIAWLAERRAAGELDDGMWMYFCGSDILTFHIIMRSLFDEVSAMASRLAARKGTVPESFDGLKKWLSKNARNKSELGLELAEAVGSCDWFEEMREVRDDLVHRSAQTIVFLEQRQVLFQVHVGPKRKILIPPVMFNENVVDFTAYSALLMARLATFLNRFAMAVFAVINDFDEEQDLSIHPVIQRRFRSTPEPTPGTSSAGVTVTRLPRTSTRPRL